MIEFLGLCAMCIQHTRIEVASKTPRVPLERTNYIRIRRTLENMSLYN